MAIPQTGEDMSLFYFHLLPIPVPAFRREETREFPRGGYLETVVLVVIVNTRAAGADRLVAVCLRHQLSGCYIAGLAVAASVWLAHDNTRREQGDGGEACEKGEAEEPSCGGCCCRWGGGRGHRIVFVVVVDDVSVFVPVVVVVVVTIGAVVVAVTGSGWWRWLVV